MTRQKKPFILPTLNDKGGDLSKPWCIDYQYYLHNKKKPERIRVFAGLSTGSEKERRQIAKKKIAEITKLLVSGDYLNLVPKEKKIVKNELQYKQYARAFGQKKLSSGIIAGINDYLNYIKQIKNETNYKAIQSYMRMFSGFLEQKNLTAKETKNFERSDIQDFVIFLVTTHRLSKVTVKKYLQAVRWLFDYLKDEKKIKANPVYRIENIGIVKDCAPVPFTREEMAKIKRTCLANNPYLWLACEIQYYCAIRPGKELRFLRIDDIDFDNQQIRIKSDIAKNNKTQIIDVPDVLMAEFERFNLKSYPSDYYVFGNKGLPSLQCYGKNAMRYQFRKVREDLDIPENRKFYSFKHTGAINLIKNGMQPYDLMDHLRHSNFDTTEKYLRKRIKSPTKKINKFVSEI